MHHSFIMSLQHVQAVCFHASEGLGAVLSYVDSLYQHLLPPLIVL